MTALTKGKMRSMERWKYYSFPLASGNVAFKNGFACLDMSTGKVEPGHAEGDLFVIGIFNEDMDASLAEKMVEVNLVEELEVDWWANGTPAVGATDVGSLAYVEDDQTVSLFAGGRTVAGRIWGYSATKGVAVQKITGGGSIGVGEGTAGALPAFAAGTLAVPAAPVSGTIYDVPTTAANSTIVLPAGAGPGTTVQFFADGTKNGHTVQYVDATGSVAITTALTASKRHLVIATFLGTTWNANAYVSP